MIRIVEILAVLLFAYSGKLVKIMSYVFPLRIIKASGENSKKVLYETLTHIRLFCVEKDSFRMRRHARAHSEHMQYGEQYAAGCVSAEQQDSINRSMQPLCWVFHIYQSNSGERVCQCFIERFRDLKISQIRLSTVR